MTPVIALVGRPNVGKSTLFNQMTRSRDALVADFPGLTRDRKYGEGNYQGQRFIVIDTGGLTGDEVGLDAEMARQSMQAVEEADIVLFLVDGRAGRPIWWSTRPTARTRTWRRRTFSNWGSSQRS